MPSGGLRKPSANPYAGTLGQVTVKTSLQRAAVIHGVAGVVVEGAGYTMLPLV